MQDKCTRSLFVWKKALNPRDLVNVLVDGHPLVPGPQHVVQVTRDGLATEESGAWWADFTLLEMSIFHLETSARSQSAPCDRGIQQNAEMIFRVQSPEVLPDLFPVFRSLAYLPAKPYFHLRHEHLQNALHSIHLTQSKAHSVHCSLHTTVVTTPC